MLKHVLYKNIWLKCLYICVTNLVNEHNVKMAYLSVLSALQFLFFYYSSTPLANILYIRYISVSKTNNSK